MGVGSGKLSSTTAGNSSIPSVTLCGVLDLEGEPVGEPLDCVAAGVVDGEPGVVGVGAGGDERGRVEPLADEGCPAFRVLRSSHHGQGAGQPAQVVVLGLAGDLGGRDGWKNFFAQWWYVGFGCCAGECGRVSFEGRPGDFLDLSDVVGDADDVGSGEDVADGCRDVGGAGWVRDGGEDLRDPCEVDAGGHCHEWCELVVEVSCDLVCSGDVECGHFLRQQREVIEDRGVVDGGDAGGDVEDLIDHELRFEDCQHARCLAEDRWRCAG